MDASADVGAAAAGAAVVVNDTSSAAAPAPPTSSAAPAPASEYGRGPGWVLLKAEHIMSREARQKREEERAAAAAAAAPSGGAGAASSGKRGGGGDDSVSGKKRARGQNKGRKGDDLGLQSGLAGQQFCRAVASGRSCRFGAKCRDSHDLASYLTTKPADLGPLCPVLLQRGACPSLVSCRFARCHTDMATGAQALQGAPVAVPPAVPPTTYGAIPAVAAAASSAGAEAPATSGAAATADASSAASPSSAAAAASPAVFSALSAWVSEGRGDVCTAGALPVTSSPVTPESLALAAEGYKTAGREVNYLPMAKLNAVQRGNYAYLLAEDCSKAGGRLAPVAKGAPAAGAAAAAAAAAAAGAASGATEVPGSAPAASSDAAPAAPAAGDAAASASGATSLDSAVGGAATTGADAPVAAAPLVVAPHISAMATPSHDGIDRWEGWVSRDARTRLVEKRKIDFKGKVYVAPLTTVGNTPFRRCLVDLGADITIGEMAMSQKLLEGDLSEWSLVRRHPSEKVFGVQLAGNNAWSMARAAELIERHCDVDFVDINMGCPLDLVCNRGMGAGLMGKPGKLREIVRSMHSILTCPLTLKMRTGLDTDVAQRFAHKVASKVRIWSAAESAVGAHDRFSFSHADGGDGSGRSLLDAVTIHGRTRQQRYSKYADWEYVKDVVRAASSPYVVAPRDMLLTAESVPAATVDRLWPRYYTTTLPSLQASHGPDAVNASLFNAGSTGIADFGHHVLPPSWAPPLPVIGNGDVLTWEEHERHIEETGVSTTLLARGALIKPWLCTEIKERMTWDISSGERLEILKRFVSYGLDHWGSDQLGINKTRRFLLEWLSFLYRYVPAGLLEQPALHPQKMNDRPPAFIGRDDLETLMSSPKAQDWVRITEMLLGPVPSDFVFVPKHKAASYAEDGGAVRAAASAAGGAASDAGRPAKLARTDAAGDVAAASASADADGGDESEVEG